MSIEIESIPDGSITTPMGFLAGATYVGLKTYGESPLDLGLLLSEIPALVAGTFTTNKVRSSSVVLSEARISSGKARGVVANSGCANACVGNQGMKDAVEMTSLAAAKLDVLPEEILACSTGIIGVELPMGLIRSGINKIGVSRNGGHEFARSILTTDHSSKEYTVSFLVDGVRVHISGCAKGAGMIHPNMATMLCFLTTDATVESTVLSHALQEVVDSTFNMISVDGDMSTNDTVLLLANGAAGASSISSGSASAETFRRALFDVCSELAKAIVRGGEGATKLIKVVVEGAQSLADARMAARSVASSLLVKTAIYGNDPNWGRIMMALGKSGAAMQESRMALYINDICIMEDGLPISYFKDAVIANMSGKEINLVANLNIGEESATAWGCDMSEAFVTFNSAYTT